MPAYRLLILDYGGVYSFDYDSSNFNRIILEAFSRLPNETERQKIIEQSHILGANKISVQAYIASLGTILDASQLPSVEQFEAITISVTNPPSKPMQKLARRVQKAGVKVSLLSDMYDFEIKKTKPLGRYDGFDYTAFSAEAGMTKYEPGFFQQTLDHFGVPAQEALFVDDVMKNIETAQSIGIATLFADKSQYKTAERLAHTIAAHLRI